MDISLIVNPVSNPVPVVGLSNIVTIANAVVITDTAIHDFDIITHGGMTESQIRQYKNFKISINNTHNQVCTASLYTAVASIGSPTSANGAGTLYSEANNIVASSGKLVLASGVGGTGSTLKVVPTLQGIHSNLIVRLTYAVAPTSGSITIKIEMN